MAMDAQVRRMRRREGLAISETARRTRLARYTIQDVRRPTRGAMQYRRPTAPKNITPYETTLRQAVEADARRPRHERRTARKRYAQLQNQGFTGSYGRITECLRTWRAVSSRSAYVPLTFAPISVVCNYPYDGR